MFQNVGGLLMQV